MLVNAMELPSGENTGDESAVLSFVSLTTLLPSAFMTYRSRLSAFKSVGSAASRVLVKTICLPSFDQLGSLLDPILFVRRTTSVPSAFMT